jgi:CheY-like chemotaxis protein
VKSSTTSTTILCVDDYAPFLRMLAWTLENQGYQVIAVTDPRQALVIATTGTDVDLVITDFTMPHMSGEELIQEIHRWRPFCPIIMLSGALDPGVGSNLRFMKGEIALDELPYHIQQLLKLEKGDSRARKNVRKNADKYPAHQADRGATTRGRTQGVSRSNTPVLPRHRSTQERHQPLAGKDPAAGPDRTAGQ